MVGSDRCKVLLGLILINVHLGYKVLYKDLPNRLPEFYQRLGVKQFFYQNWFAGLNVRFHELGSADNLEWNIGYKLDM